jgi:hypothetical protein
MTNNKIERPKTVIKTIVAPLNTELKNKVKIAFQQVVTKIKEKHL